MQSSAAQGDLPMWPFGNIVFGIRRTVALKSDQANSSSIRIKIFDPGSSYVCIRGRIRGAAPCYRKLHRVSSE